MAESPESFLHALGIAADHDAPPDHLWASTAAAIANPETPLLPSDVVPLMDDTGDSADGNDAPKEFDPSFDEFDTAVSHEHGTAAHDPGGWADHRTDEHWAGGDDDGTGHHGHHDPGHGEQHSTGFDGHDHGAGL